MVARTDATRARIGARANRHRKYTRERGTQEQFSGSRSASFVVSEQSAESRFTDDLFARVERIIGVAPLAGEGAVADALMRPKRVVEVDVGGDQEVEVLLPEDDEMAAYLVPTVAAEALNIDGAGVNNYNGPRPLRPAGEAGVVELRD